MYSSSTRGRKPASYCASSSTRVAVTIRSSVIQHCSRGPIPARSRFAALPSGGPPQRGCHVRDPGASLGPPALHLLAGPHISHGAGAPPPALGSGLSLARGDDPRIGHIEM